LNKLQYLDEQKEDKNDKGCTGAKSIEIERSSLGSINL
jgi:hypothetical protein